MKRSLHLLSLLSMMALLSFPAAAQSTRPGGKSVFDAMSFAGKPDRIPGTLKMAMVYSFSWIGNLTPAILDGRMDDPAMWRHIGQSIARDADAICLNIEGEWRGSKLGPQYEMPSAERQQSYQRCAELVRMVKERYRKPVGVYFFPPVVWLQHAGPSDAYAESVRQSKVLMDVVDFLAPCGYACYSFGGDMDQWRRWHSGELARARTEQLLLYQWNGRRVPIYFFLSPQYESGVQPKELYGTSVGKERLLEMLRWSREHADGAVLWGGRDVNDKDGVRKLPWRGRAARVDGWEWIGEAVNEN